MKVLGISCYFHDSAACIVENGKIIAACQEERFSRLKMTYPVQAIKFCLKQSGIDINEVDKIVFYEDTEKEI